MFGFLMTIAVLALIGAACVFLFHPVVAVFARMFRAGRQWAKRINPPLVERTVTTRGGETLGRCPYCERTFRRAQ